MIAELNGAADVKPWYGRGGDVYGDAVFELLRTAVDRRAKSYGRIVAVDDVDLTVHEGDIYGFLGPNGAGKTTAMRILLGLISPNGGEVRLFGRDPQHDAGGARRRRGLSRRRISTRI